MAEIEELIKIRKEKESKIKDYGEIIRPDRFEYSHTLKEARALNDGTENVSIAGRLMAKRKMGKISFFDIQDIEGYIQVVIKKAQIGEDLYNKLHETIDIGDFIGVTGSIFTTQAGEKSLQAQKYQFLGKAYRPLPEKFHGLNSIEQQYRERHLDLIMNDDTKKRFLLRSKFLRLFRNYMDEHGFIEVETPVLQNKASGALAKPFIAHHNAHDMDVFLRIAPELTLKKLIIGGFTNVYEVARNFRNEGIDTSHLQDFTMIEGYSAYWNYQDNMKYIEGMIKHIIKGLYDTTIIEIGDKMVDFGKKWETVTFRNLLLKDTGIDIDNYQDSKSLLSEIRKKKINLDIDNIEQLGRGNLIDQLYKKVSRPNIVGPIYLTEHPADLSPLARSNDQRPDITDRFQLIVNGQEILNGYSELVDAQEQEKRLIDQSKLKTNGDEEAMDIDYEYIQAMEYGMPPISGWGLGVDRFMQFLTNRENIRDVVLYPLMKPKGKFLTKNEESKDSILKECSKQLQSMKDKKITKKFIIKQDEKKADFMENVNNYVERLQTKFPNTKPVFNIVLDNNKQKIGLEVILEEKNIENGIININECIDKKLI